MQFCTTISAIRQKTERVKSFELDYGDQEFSYYPGQWVDIHLTIDDESHNCGYSITSIPSSKHSVEIAVKQAPDLALTNFLHNKCKVGDQVFISQAKGDIYLTADISGAYVFIAGGVGITPLYSMIQYIMQIKPQTPVTLIYSIATLDDFLFEKEIRKLEEQHKQFKCYVTVTRQPRHNADFNGRISQQLLQSLHLPAQANYYLCGPPAMVDSVADMLSGMQDELQISGKNIHYDKWWA